MACDRMPRLLIVNDYSISNSWRDAREKRSPIHFLYGVDYLEEDGFELTLVSEQRFPRLSALDRRAGRLGVAFGSLDRQVAAWKDLGRVDAIYAPCQTQIQTLTYLRALGLIRVPIIFLAHHRLVRGRLGRMFRPLTRLMLQGVAAVPALSRVVADEANGLAGRSVGTALAWGPDAGFYPPAEYPGQGVLAAGRTGRDFVTFGRAASTAKTPVTILTLREGAPAELISFASNVTIVMAERFIDYSTTARMFASSRALAIPMLAQNGLCGLTSLMDALGAGKPVIMTRNPLIDLDIEALGIGRWVDAGDVAGWVDALRFFTDNPEAATEMGRRARALVEAGLDYRSFSKQVARIVRESL